MSGVNFREACVRTIIALRDGRKGQVSIIFAASAMTLLSAVSANIDAATLHARSDRLQSAVDGAALHVLREASVKGLSDEEAAQEAAKILDANGASKASEPELRERERTEARVLSSNPLRLTITTTRMVELPFGFMTAKHVAISRTAQVTEAQQTPVSLLLLSETSPQAWTASGSSKVSVSGAAVVNSSSASALDGSGAAQVIAETTLVAGPASAASNWTPAPKFDARRVEDPFKAQVRWPAGGACDHQNLSLKKGEVTLTPGVYCGGLSLQAHADVTLAPGVYVLRDGPLVVAAHSVLSGPDGVTIVLTGETAYVDVRSGSQLTLKAPDSGEWKHIAMAVQPQSEERVSTLIGGGELVLDGVLYFPTQKLRVTGGGSAHATAGTRVLVANRLQTNGNGEIVLRGSNAVASIATGGRLER